MVELVKVSNNVSSKKNSMINCGNIIMFRNNVILIGIELL